MTSAVVTDLTLLTLIEPYGGNRCAADVLGLFRWFSEKERPGYWFKARYTDIAQYLGGLYPKSAIAKATKLLNDLGILLQHRHSKDGQIRTFYYEFRPEKLSSINETLEVQNETLEVQNETLEVQNETLTIYINPTSLFPHGLDPLPDPWHEEKEKEGDFESRPLHTAEQFDSLLNEQQERTSIFCEDKSSAASSPVLISCEDKSSAASSPVPKKRTNEEPEVWEIAPGRPYPVFLNWWASIKYKPQGGHWAADALGNAYAEFYNNRQKTTVAIFPQFLEYMQQVTENCNQSLNAEFKALLPSCFILHPEATRENVQHLMKNVQSLIDKGVEVALSAHATPSCTQSMSFGSAANQRINPMPNLPKLTSNAASDNLWGCDRSLENDLARYQAAWKYGTKDRKSIVDWVTHTNGVTLGIDGPELEGEPQCR